MYIREYRNCTSDTVKKNASFPRVLLNAAIANLVGIVIKVVLSVIINFTPIGWILALIEAFIPSIETFKESLMYSLASVTTILGINMYQASYLEKYCSTEQSLVAPISVTCASLVVTTIYYLFKTYSPV